MSIHYDPMIAKVVTRGADREQSVQRMRRALQALSVQGLTTNRAFLLDILAHERFLSGELHTHFIDEHYPDGYAPAVDAGLMEDLAIAATLAAQAEREAERGVLPSIPSGYRLNRVQNEWAEYGEGEAKVRVEYAHVGGGRFTIVTPSGERAARRIAWRREGAATVIRLELDGLRRDYRVVRRGRADTSRAHAGGRRAADRGGALPGLDGERPGRGLCGADARQDHRGAGRRG